MLREEKIVFRQVSEFGARPLREEKKLILRISFENDTGLRVRVRKLRFGNVPNPAMSQIR